MSGLEIVGVVLGAIPITVVLIEQYRQRQIRIDFRKKEPFVLRLIQSLKFQHYLLLNDIKLTLKGAGVEVDESVIQSNPSLFGDTAVAEAVQDYLGPDCSIYFEAVEGCHMVLTRIFGSIKGLEEVSDLKSLVTTYRQSPLPKKIRFRIGRDEISRQIQELETATTTLQRISESMTAQRVQVTLPSSSRQTARLTSSLNTIRDYARRLYCAVSAAYPSKCHSYHEARLFLYSRSNLMERRATNKLDDFEFTVLFSTDTPTTDPADSYKADITVKDPGDCTQKQSQQNHPQKRVVIRLPTPPRSVDPPRTAMDDLCKSIRRARDGGIVLDLQLSDPTCLMYYYLHDANLFNRMHLTVNPDGFISLKQLLEDERGVPWLPNHKRSLSFTVVSSLLQLVTTPWLRLPLTSSTVRFSRNSVKASTVDFSLVPEAFVQERFLSSIGLVSAHESCNVRQYMLELGILLLEIEHWRTIEDYENELLKKGLPMPPDRYGLARSWVDSTWSTCHLLPSQVDAISRCLECTFATSSATPSWDDAVLRKSIAELVLKPLRETCPPQFR